jgi:hypothetical protein
MMCHVNTTGGGMRTSYGSAYAQNILAAEPIAANYDMKTDALPLLVNLGGDLRSDFSYTAIPHEGDRNAFDDPDLRVYLAANVIPNRLVIYADQRIAPASLNQEAWLRLWLDPDQHFYVKAGQMYLPFGWRLQDQTALVRLASGINMDSPDRGVEAGYESGPWTAQLDVTNGTPGATENDQGKQVTARGEYVTPNWRAGASADYNHAQAGSRTMGGVFAGFKTGSIVWLAEADYIQDQSLAPFPRKLLAGLLEADWNIKQGHNLKVTVEHFDPSREVANDAQERYSAVWEYTPIQFLQLRVGPRIYRGIPQNDLQNRQFYFAELHAFF